jgi:TetR/AcrR family transcriptional regulator
MSDAAIAAPVAVPFRSTRMTAGARRQQLIEQAIHLFATTGFRGTTTKAIAQAAGVSEAVIFRHFATKDDLYNAILKLKADESGLTELQAALKQHAARGEDEELVLRLVRHILDSHDRDPDFQRVMLFAAVEGHDLAKAGAAYGVPFFGFLRGYIVARQRAGVFRRGDPDLMMFGLIALPVHYSIVARLFTVEPGCSSHRRIAEEFTNIILGGLRREKRPRRHNGKRKAAGK